jgi:hypothetical protein
VELRKTSGMSQQAGPSQQHAKLQISSDLLIINPFIALFAADGSFT